jgi:hypothetical protein
MVDDRCHRSLQTSLVVGVSAHDGRDGLDTGEDRRFYLWLSFPQLCSKADVRLALCAATIVPVPTHILPRSQWII